MTSPHLNSMEIVEAEASFAHYELYFLDNRTFQNPVHNIHAFDYLPDDRIIVIKPEVVDEVHERLATLFFCPFCPLPFFPRRLYHRDKNADFLLIILRDVVIHRPDLKYQNRLNAYSNHSINSSFGYVGLY